MTTKTALVIGGGVIGSSVAYHLARSTKILTTLVSSSGPAICATSRSAGMVIQSGSKGKVKLVQATIEDISNLQEELDDDLGFKQCGTLRVAVSPDNVQRLDADYRVASQEGVDVSYLSVSEAQELLPWLHFPDPSSKITFTKNDGFIDPTILASSYLSAGRRHGLETRFNQKVTEIGPDGQVTFEDAPPQRYDYIIDACGLWAGLLGFKSLSLPPLQLSPVRSHYWLTQPSSIFSSSSSSTMPNVILPDIGVYTRSYNGGIILGVQEEHSLTFDSRDLEIEDESHGFLDSLEDVALERLEERYEQIECVIPEIGSVEFSSYSPGWSTYTSDGRYILGKQSNEDINAQLFVASGCNGSGVSASGGIGRAMADRVAERSKDFGEFDVTRFDPFPIAEEVFSEEFRKACASSRTKKFNAE